MQGAFDAVQRKEALYKLHKADIANNLLSVFSSFLTDRFYRNLVNSYTSDWDCTITGVLQGSLLSPFIFLVFTADMTLEEPKKTPEVPTESEYADGFKFWRIATDSKTQSTSQKQTRCIIFYDKEKLPPPPIPVTINRSSLTKVKAKRVLRIITDKDLTFTRHVKHISQKCKMAYNRLTLYPDLSPHLAFQLYKAFISSKLEFGCTVWVL